MADRDQVVDQVQSLNDIVEIISGYLPLKRAGRNFKAVCPFHQEKTPSFMVNPDKQIFHCFGCGAGGDVFSFLMKHEQMTFPEALRRLAERVHITLPEMKRVPPAEKSFTERLYHMYALAAEFYHANLKHPETGAKARAYLSKRAFGLPEIDSFQLGYALSDWRTLFEFLSKKGFQTEELLRSGLIARSSQGNPYDLFRDRLLFPIWNVPGKVIAFGGRTFGEDQPKYLNSPETPIFKKRKELYALNAAKRAASLSADVRRLLIVEGYLDAIRLHMSGFQHTVATLGTSLTSEHVQTLKRYADEAVVVFDGDKAGEQAALRGLDIFLEEGMGVKVLCLPKGYDPDDFVRSMGRDAFEDLLRECQDVFDFKLQILLKRFNKADSAGLLKITSEFLDTFSKIKSPVLTDRYLKKLSLALGVEERSLRSELQKWTSKKRPGAAEQKWVSKPVFGVDPPVEKLLVSLFLNYPPYLETFRSMFPGYSFSGDRVRAVFHVLEGLIRDGNRREHLPRTTESPVPLEREHVLTGHACEGVVRGLPSRLLSRIPDDSLKAFASQLLMMDWPSGEDRERAFQDCLKSVHNQVRSDELRKLKDELARAEEAGNQDLVLECMKSYQALLKQTNA